MATRPDSAGRLDDWNLNLSRQLIYAGFGTDAQTVVLFLWPAQLDHKIAQALVGVPKRPISNVGPVDCRDAQAGRHSECQSLYPALGNLEIE